MANLGETITVSSVNCRGLQDIPKRVDVLDYIKKLKSHIICLQDTHWTDEQLRTITTTWNGECHIHGINTSSRGVAILLSKNFEYAVEKVTKKGDGNAMTMNIKISNEFTIKIINIYGPNTDSPTFYDYVEAEVSSSECDYTVICGDFNLALDQEMDTLNYKTINNPRAKKKILETMENHDLIDIYRT